MKARIIMVGLTLVTSFIVAILIVGMSQFQSVPANAQRIPGIEPNPVTPVNPLAPINHTGDPNTIVIGNLNSTVTPPPKINSTETS